MRNNRTNTPKWGDPKLLTKHELAEELQLSYYTVDQWSREGKIPAIYHPLGAGRGRKVYFYLPDVLRSLKTVVRPLR